MQNVPLENKSDFTFSLISRDQSFLRMWIDKYVFNFKAHSTLTNDSSCKSSNSVVLNGISSPDQNLSNLNLASFITYSCDLCRRKIISFSSLYMSLRRQTPAVAGQVNICDKTVQSGSLGQ